MENTEEHINKFVEGDDKTETLLHVAVKYLDDISLIESLIKICPTLVTSSRQRSIYYKGQTPLHIAITKCNIELTILLVRYASNIHKKQQLFRTQATGHLFANTVMMGELPLNVAALTLNKPIVKYLLNRKADIHSTKTSTGDTIMHSLIRYAAIYPTKTENVISMLDVINERLKTQDGGHRQIMQSDIYLQADLYVWFEKNNNYLTPLQLSAKLGVVKIFQFIMNLPNVYSFVSAFDGLFDVKLYDITEIDTVRNRQVEAKTMYNEKELKNNVPTEGPPKRPKVAIEDRNPFNECSCDNPRTESILEMMFGFDYPNSAAFEIIETIPVKTVILKKWAKLQYWYFLWGFLHFFLTICLTATTVIKSEMYSNTTFLDIEISNGSVAFTQGSLWFSFLFGGCIYLIMFIRLVIAKYRRPNALNYATHNLGYMLFLFVCSMCLIIDFIITQLSSTHDNISLILAVISAWWFCVFFVRALRIFSFFTEMIRRVLIGDLLRFAVIIFFVLFGFTAAMYAVFLGKISKDKQTDAYRDAVKENFNSFGDSTLTMFKLMLGLGDIEVLNEARIPGLAITLYVVFVILTYILLINSLIAMMSQTCALVLEDRYPQWRFQQLSVLLFLEDLLCVFCNEKILFSCGTKKTLHGFYVGKNQLEDYERYYLKVHSLLLTYASEEDLEGMKYTMKERWFSERREAPNFGIETWSSILSNTLRRDDETPRFSKSINTTHRDRRHQTGHQKNVDDDETPRLNKSTNTPRHTGTEENMDEYKSHRFNSGVLRVEEYDDDTELQTPCLDIDEQ